MDDSISNLPLPTLNLADIQHYRLKPKYLNRKVHEFLLINKIYFVVFLGFVRLGQFQRLALQARSGRGDQALRPHVTNFESLTMYIY